jgi:hypothetical protein
VIPALQIHGTSAGGNIIPTYVAQQNIYCLSLSPNGQAPPPDAAILSALANQALANIIPDMAANLKHLQEELCVRVRRWGVDIQRMMDNVDRPGLHQAIQELEPWLEKNSPQLRREDRARCLVLLARIEIFFASDEQSDGGE